MTGHCGHQCGHQLSLLALLLLQLGAALPPWPAVLLFKKNLFILFILFLSAVGLLCCVRAFSSCGEWGLLFVAVHGLLIVVASLVAEHRL